MVLWKRLFSGVVLCTCRMDTGGGEGVSLTLGNGVGREVYRDSNGGTTLGAAAAGESNRSGMCSIRFSWVARVTSALCTRLPACRLGVVVEGGRVRMEIMSLAACRRKY